MSEPDARPKLKIRRLSPEETAAREQERTKRLMEYGAGRKQLAETIGERELRLLREREAIRKQRKQEREAEEATRAAARTRDEQLLNIIPSAYTGKAHVEEAPSQYQYGISMEGLRQRQASAVARKFPMEPTGRSNWLYNLKPLKPSLLDLQAQEKERRETTDRIRAGRRGTPFVPVYHMG